MGRESGHREWEEYPIYRWKEEKVGKPFGDYHYNQYRVASPVEYHYDVHYYFWLGEEG